MQLSFFFPIMAEVSRGFEVKTQLFESAPGARDPKDGGAFCAAVFAPHSSEVIANAVAKKTLAVSSLLVLGLLVGCGGSGSSTSVSGEQPQNAETTTGSAPPAPGASDSEESPTPLEAPSASADVLLLEPAGNTDLPEDVTPTVKFKSLQVDDSNLVATDGGAESLSSSASPTSGAVTVSWDPPNQNADGSNLSDLAGYRVYQGNEERLSIVQELNETGAGERRLAQIPDVTEANSCFAVTAYDTSGNESALGDVICKDEIVPAPATNSLAPTFTSITQLSTSDGVASLSLRWQPPAESSASTGASIDNYSVFHGTQSQLFKIKEITEQDANDGSGRSGIVEGIGGEQACFALTALYTDGHETSLGEIVCVALVHSTPPVPGDQLRPFDVSVDILSGNRAQVSWDKPNTVVSSADATSIDRYDLYQGSQSQVFKIGEIDETGEAGTRRTTIVDSVFDGSNCFALTATDQSQRQSALSSIICGAINGEDGSPVRNLPDGGVLGVTGLTAEETSPGSVAIEWDVPDLVVSSQPIENLEGYNLYQGSNTQLFKVAEIDHTVNAARQQYQRSGVDGNNACFAVTAYDINGYESPLSEVICAAVSGSATAPQFAIDPPTEIATSGLGGSTTITLTWLATGAATTGSADLNVNHYNIYQGDHDRLFKVREVRQEQNGNTRGSAIFTDVNLNSVCFAITAQYVDLRESRLSDIVCRDD